MDEARFRLIRLENGESTTVWDIPCRGLIIGRDAPDFKPDIVIADTRVSRRHCKVIPGGREIFVENMSGNELRLNGHDLAGYSPAGDGDTISFFDHEFQLEIELPPVSRIQSIKPLKNLLLLITVLAAGFIVLSRRGNQTAAVEVPDAQRRMSAHHWKQPLEYGNQLFDERNAVQGNRYVALTAFQEAESLGLPDSLSMLCRERARCLTHELDSLADLCFDRADLALRQGDSKQAQKWLRETQGYLPDPRDERNIKASQALERIAQTHGN